MSRDRSGRDRSLSLASLLLDEDASPRNFYSVHRLSSGVNQVVRLAFPNVASFVVSYLSTVVTALCISRLDRADLLAAVGLGNLLSNMLGYAIGIGLMSVLDTVISQSAGSGNFHLSLVHLTRGRLVSLVTVIPCTLALLHSQKFLRFLGQDPQTALHCAEFVKFASIGLLPYFFFIADCSYLRAYHVTLPQLLVNSVAAVFQIGICVLFVNVWNWGLAGAGLSLSLAHWTRWALLQAYVLQGGSKTLPGEVVEGCSFRAFLKEVRAELRGRLAGRLAGRASDAGGVGEGQRVFCPETGVAAGLQEFLWLQANSAMILLGEWWLYQALALLAGTLGVAVLAAHVVCVNVETIVYMVPLGFQQATSVLVGNALGAGKPRQAASYSRICVTMSVSINILVGFGIYKWRNAIAYMYSTDEEVLGMLDTGLAVIAVFQGIDGLNCVLEGVLRGLRLQEKAVLAKAAVMTGIQLPLAYFLGHQIGLLGIWLAASLGFALSCAIYAYIIAKADFNGCAIAAIKEANRTDALLAANSQI